MNIKTQIRLRREKLGWSVKNLADSVEVSSTAVRNWQSGRNLPNKKQAEAIEKAMSTPDSQFSLDWNEGKSLGGSTSAAMVDAKDLELLITICALPAGAKRLISDMAKMHVEACNKMREAGITLPPSSAGESQGDVGPGPDIQRSTTRRPVAQAKQ